MINLLFGMITLLLSTVTFTGEDDGEMLYSVKTDTIIHDYVTEKELNTYFTTGTIRNQKTNLQKTKNYENNNTIMLSNVRNECSSTK